LELYPIFYSNEKFILVHGRALGFISSLIHRSGQFLFFWSRLAVSLDLVHGTRAAAVGLGLFFCYRTAPFSLVLSLPQQALTPIDFVLHLPFWSGRREPGCCTILSAARSKPEFFSSFRTVYVSLLDLVHLPLPVSMVPCFAAVALVFTATCCALVFDSFSRLAGMLVLYSCLDPPTGLYFQLLHSGPSGRLLSASDFCLGLVPWKARPGFWLFWPPSVFILRLVLCACHG
jgi:hypothetical protein